VKISGLKPTTNPLSLPSGDSIDSLGLTLSEDGLVAVEVTPAYHSMFCNHPAGVPCSYVIPAAADSKVPNDTESAFNHLDEEKAKVGAAPLPWQNDDLWMASLLVDKNLDLGVGGGFFDLDMGGADFFDLDMGGADEWGFDGVPQEPHADPFALNPPPPPPVIHKQAVYRGLLDQEAVAVADNPPSIPAPVVDDELITRVTREVNNCIAEGDRAQMMSMLTLLEEKVSAIRAELYGDLNNSLDDLLNH
jgi:hypothetical protein